MKFQYEAEQPHQRAAIDAVLDLFEGADRDAGGLRFAKGASFAIEPNDLRIGSAELLANMRAVQARSGLDITAGETDTFLTKAEVELVEGAAQVAFPSFSIDMETGTGKTYVYIRTALELSKRLGLRKFVIVVPTVPIREGVLKTFDTTRAHFRSLFPDLPYQWFAYDSGSPGDIRNFALSGATEFMVITIAAFGRAKALFDKPNQLLSNEKPISFIQSLRPIVVLDEPQRMSSDLAVASIASLNPSFVLRYSATHVDRSNEIHRLTPYDAYRQGLVKQVEVASVQDRGAGAGGPLIRVEKIEAVKRTQVATLSVETIGRDGRPAPASLKVKPGQDLEKLTKRSEYQSYVVEEINADGEFVSFSNGVEAQLAATVGIGRDLVMEGQIRATIREHIAKQRRLKARGIKVLSLFFIDRVASYTGENGFVRETFDRVFDELKAGDDLFAEKEARSVRAAYFATRKVKGRTEAVDTKGDEKDEEAAAFRLIMRDKERLLQFDNDVSFIFSHSALREGWDSPNVFQVCVLREVGSPIERRQQIGRGARLAVNQDGIRVPDRAANILTVVVSESYASFVETLQAETKAQFGGEAQIPRIERKREETRVRLRSAKLKDPAFIELWNLVSRRTRYSIDLKTDRLVTGTLERLANVEIRDPMISVSKARVTAEADSFDIAIQTGATSLVDLVGRYPLPNIVEQIENALAASNPPARLTRSTILRILHEASSPAMLRNPAGFASACAMAIRETLAHEMVRGVQYRRTGSSYSISMLMEEVPAWSDMVYRTRSGDDAPALYDGVIFDSEFEKQFAAFLDRNEEVVAYLKLPGWFVVPTPVGNYNPDWAIAVRSETHPKLYLVRETKGIEDPLSLRGREALKIEAAAEHFVETLGVDYSVTMPPLDDRTLLPSLSRPD
ncbi:DEAD/DEAH box helicase family protein [Sphingomonas paucimobilis]|uniref:restriction endonuclease n=1 Tax=Sphingomonas paucimobilis TaxID=13689 RepID=UPI0037A25D18